MIATREPRDQEERLKSISDSMMGREPSVRPDWWQRFDQVSRTNAISHAKPLSELRKSHRKSPEALNKIDRAIAESGRIEQNLLWLPLTSRRNTDWVALVDAKTADPLAYAAMDGFNIYIGFALFCNLRRYSHALAKSICPRTFCGHGAVAGVIGLLGCGASCSATCCPECAGVGSMLASSGPHERVASPMPIPAYRALVRTVDQPLIGRYGLRQSAPAQPVCLAVRDGVVGSAVFTADHGTKG